MSFLKARFYKLWNCLQRINDYFECLELMVLQRSGTERNFKKKRETFRKECLNAVQALLWKGGQTPSFWLILVGRRATRPAATFPPDCLEEYVYLMLVPPFMQDAWEARHERRKRKGKETQLHHSKSFLLPLQRNKQKEGKQQTKLGLFCSSTLTKMESGIINVNQRQVLQLTWSSGVAVQSGSKIRGSLILWHSAFWLCTAKSVLGGTHGAPCNQCHTSSAHTSAYDWDVGIIGWTANPWNLLISSSTDSPDTRLPL